jgi:hypothetical protein
MVAVDTFGWVELDSEGRIGQSDRRQTVKIGDNDV